jgi:GABA permease
MRTPIRSETEAFRFALAGALLIGASLVIGWLTAPLAGVAAFALGAAVALIAYLRAPNPDRPARLRDAAHAPHPDGARAGRRHVLVVANEPLSGYELRKRLARADRERTQIDVLAPVLASRAHYAVSDIDREIEQARARLESSLAWAHAHGIEAHGEVGDPSPAVAIEDELRAFGADEVIVVTHPPGHASWQERDEVERLQRELDVPVSHVVVGDDESPGS